MLQVLGAGFPRTGTMSTKAALEQLGLGPCYHFVTQFERPQDAEVWLAAAHGRPVDWRALFADFQAAVDWPQSAFYRQLMDEYPDAKVLLNVRDPEKWYASVLATVYPASRSGLTLPEEAGLKRAAQAIDALGWQGIFQGRFEDKDYALGVFERWNRSVQKVVPAERLLVWEVQEGWEPLCRFLNLPVPDAPFPRLNDSETFQRQFMQERSAAPAAAAHQ